MECAVGPADRDDEGISRQEGHGLLLLLLLLMRKGMSSSGERGFEKGRGSSLGAHFNMIVEGMALRVDSLPTRPGEPWGHQPHAGRARQLHEAGMGAVATRVD